MKTDRKGLRLGNDILKIKLRRQNKFDQSLQEPCMETAWFHEGITHSSLEIRKNGVYTVQCTHCMLMKRCIVQ